MGELWILPRQQAEQNEGSILLMFGMLQLGLMVLTTETEGWSSLICDSLIHFAFFDKIV